MKSKIWITICAGIGIAVMLAVCIVGFINSDKAEPHISFGASDVVYSLDMNQADLLEGVSATDNHDGDVTARIVIEKIIEKHEDNTAIVYYAVSDKAGNVSKASRIFEADYSEKSVDDIQVEETSDINEDNVINQETSTNEEASVNNQETEGESTEESDAENTVAEAEIQALEEALEEAQARADSAEAELDKMKQAENKRREDEKKQTEAAQVAEVEPTAVPAANGSPQITLKSNDITTTVGMAPAWVNCIGSLTDDKDSYADLFSRLSYSKYDLNSKGPHRVSLTVTDKDGNVSNTVYVNVIVK